MKIEKINLFHLRMALRNPFETSFGKICTRDCVLIEVCVGGLHGWGECVADWAPGYSYETVETAWHVLRDFIIPEILGKKLVGPDEFQKQISFIRGHPMTKAGVEMALWDLQGKTESRSLKNLIGGVRERVEVGVSVGLQSSPKNLVNIVSDFIKQGYQRVKIKIKPGRDIEDTRLVREAYPNLHLQVDANSAYRLENSDRLLELDNFNLLLIEQPLADDDLWDHRRLQRKLQTPICLDESILSLRHTRQAIEMGACRIINIKSGRVGGISEAIAIHNFCYKKKIPVWCGGMLETGVGRATNLALASLPGFSLPGDISATTRYYYQDITNEEFSLNPDSTISVPESDGLGITINQKQIAKMSLRQQSFSI